MITRHERRARSIFVQVERRRVSQKIVAFRMGISYANLRKILERFRREFESVTKKP